MARRALRAELNPTLRNPNTRSKQDALKPNGGYHVRILTIALTTMAVVLLAGWAEATTLAGTESLPSSTRDFSPIEKVGCGGPGRCPAGLHWFCRMADAGASPAAAMFVLMLLPEFTSVPVPTIAIGINY